MKDVDYIAAVVAELRPHFPQIERRFNEENERFKALLATDRSIVAQVVKFHLIVEVYLNRFLAARYPKLAWDDADLRFGQKIQLVGSDRTDRVQFVAPGIKELNRIRNRFGHRLDASLDLSDEAEMLHCLSIARAGVTSSDPVLVIQDFTAVACTFLTVHEDVEEVFERAYERASARRT